MAMAATEPFSYWPAPAKLNLFLRVTGRRADGYHQLATLFQLLDFGDTIGLRVRNDRQIRRVAGNPQVPVDQDLALRAASALAAASGCDRGVDIEVRKTIPLGGGLGGGSSDAATVLVALDHLWGTRLGLDRLAELGLRLGADVPVFVRGRSAFATGIGEELTPMTIGQRSYLLLDPQVAVSTAEVFAAPDLTRDAPPETIAGWLANGTTVNDLEPVVRRRYPPIEAAMLWLARYGAPQLSGSGGCVFVKVDDPTLASDAVGQCPLPWRAWWVRGLDMSPLHRQLDAIVTGAA